MNRQPLVLEKCRQEALELHIAIESNKWKMKCGKIEDHIASWVTEV